jgi:hypothetical protein
LNLLSQRLFRYLTDYNTCHIIVRNEILTFSEKRSVAPRHLSLSDKYLYRFDLMFIDHE